MLIFLVHHADAVAPGVDARRPLSDIGLAQAQWLAEHARDRRVHPAVIWHSGKLRSRQTAEQFLKTCNPMADFRIMRGLQPGDPTLWIENALLAEQTDVLLVGHLPHLPALAVALGAGEPWPLNGMMAFERTQPAGWVHLWTAAPPRPVP